jgi:glycosyltransferase involved in cell wall biosynthesis
MNIAQISATFPPYMAGTGIACFHNSLELSKLNHNVTVFTGTQSNEPIDNCPKFNVVRLNPMFTIGNAPFIPDLFKVKDFDIIHLHYPFYIGGEIIYLLKKLRSQKYVITYHNDVVGSGILNNLFKIHDFTLMKLILRNSSCICVHTMDYAKNSNLKSLLGKCKFAEIPNGVDTVHFNPSISSFLVKDKYDLHEKKIILFVRALDSAHHHSGLEYLLQSLSLIKDENTVLLVVGDGNLKQFYIEEAVKLGITKRVFFVGKLGHDVLPLYYAASDVVVLPSSLTENFPLVLLEAMSSGKPVICSNLPGVRNIVDNHVNGLLVEPRDPHDLQSKIKYLLEHETERERLGKNGRLKAQNKFSWQKIALQLEKIYKEVLA